MFDASFKKLSKRLYRRSRKENLLLGGVMSAAGFVLVFSMCRDSLRFSFLFQSENKFDFAVDVVFWVLVGILILLIGALCSWIELKRPSDVLPAATTLQEVLGHYLLLGLAVLASVVLIWLAEIVAIALVPYTYKIGNLHAINLVTLLVALLGGISLLFAIGKMHCSYLDKNADDEA